MLPAKLNTIKEIMYNLLSNTDSNSPDIVMDQKMELVQHSGSKNLVFQIQNANIKFINDNVVEVFKLLDEIEKESAEVIDVSSQKTDYDEAITDLVAVAYSKGIVLNEVTNDVKRELVDIAINDLPTNCAAARKLGIDPSTLGQWVKRYEL